MTEPGDPVARRYRELAREEPGAALDDAILAASRREVGARPGKRGGTARWMGPVSIAAVLVLGIGVSLRMQLEKPGIETSMPTQSSGEYPVPPADEAPAPPPQAKAAPAEEQARARQQPAPAELSAAARPDAAVPKEKKADTRAAVAEKPLADKQLAKRLEAPAQPAEAESARSRPEPNPFTDAPVVLQQAPVPASPPSVAMTAPVTVPAPPPAPRAAAAPPAQRAAPEPPAAAEPPAAVAESRAPAAAGASAPAGAPSPQSAPLRAKREGFAADNAARESRAIGAIADPDPTRELERIARLREAGRHADADRALTEFRRNHPDFRIPEAMWERVRPR